MKKLNKSRIKKVIRSDETISVKELYRRYFEVSDPTLETLVEFFDKQVMPSKYLEVIFPTREYPYHRVRRKNIIDIITFI